jgi:hypothetical protein
LEDREALLKSLASHLVDKIIVDVTNVHYFFGDSHWGQISSTLRNRDALGAPARWPLPSKKPLLYVLNFNAHRKHLALAWTMSLDFELAIFHNCTFTQLDSFILA